MESPELAKENHFSLACQATFSFFCPLWSAPGSAGASPDKVARAIEFARRFCNRKLQSYS